MNDTLIVYKTKHNTTKQYAHWIHEQIKSDLVNIKFVHKVDLSSYKVVIFGSWIYDDKITIAPYIEKHWDVLQDKHIILFCDGLTDPRDDKMLEIFENSLPRHIREKIYFYPLGGRLSFDTISLWDKLVLKFKGKFRETNLKSDLFVKPIVVKAYELKMLK